MRIVEDLLAAQRRPADEARRLTDAAGAALDGAWDPARYPHPATAGDTAADSYLAVARQIDDEKRPYPLVPDADDSEAGEEEQSPDATATEQPNPATPHASPTAPVAEDTGAAGLLPDTSGADFPEDSFEEDDNGAAAEESDAGSDRDGDDPRAGDDPDEQDQESRPAENSVEQPTEAATEPLPSAARYEWDQVEEIQRTGPGEASTDTDDADTGPIAPSSRPTAPPHGIPLPEPDPRPSLPQRLRERSSSLTSRMHGTSARGRWLAAAAVAAVAVVVGASVALTGGRATPPQPAETVAAPVSTDNPPPAPTDVVLTPDFVSASCGGDTDPVAPFRGDKSRAWVCTRVNGIDGAVLNITFNNPVIITRIDIVPGFNYVAPDGRDEWIHHRLVTEVVWRMGGKKFTQQINPVRTGVSMVFPEVPTTQMSLTITGSASPPKGAENADGIGKGLSGTVADVDQTTAISGIVIKGRPADPAAG